MAWGMNTNRLEALLKVAKEDRDNPDSDDDIETLKKEYRVTQQNYKANIKTEFVPIVYVEPPILVKSNDSIKENAELMAVIDLPTRIQLQMKIFTLKMKYLLHIATQILLLTPSLKKLSVLQCKYFTHTYLLLSRKFDR